MIHDISMLLLALVAILISSELFTNGLEWLGHRLQLSDGVVGSVIAAVGTALPETLIPFIAVIFYQKYHGEEVGIGAIAGAPFMLSTLTLALCGISVLLYNLQGLRSKELKMDIHVLKRDLSFFLICYTTAIASSLLPLNTFNRYAVAGCLLAAYPLYVYKTFKHEGEPGAASERLYLDRIFNKGSHRLRFILLQVVLSVIGIITGAIVFVDHVQSFADSLGFPPVILTLIIAPIATELPEKINSILWLRNGKDTLALGNVTGAMVFQSCIPVSFGIAFTHWKLTLGSLSSAIVAITIAAIYYLLLRYHKLKAEYLCLGLFVYICTVGYIISRNLHLH